jgi:ribosomal protein S12 methylthiotransferase
VSEKIKVGMVSLGCPKNQVDAELMLSKITNEGFELVNEAGLADVVIINTCGFIQSAKEEAIQEILEAASRKEDGINKKIIVTGCMAQRYTKEIEEEFPEVDAIVGLGQNRNIVDAIREVLADKRVVLEGKISEHDLEGSRLLTTMSHYAYLRVADGCSNCCTYCAIPLIRGKFRSRPMENLIEEAKGLVKNGVRELVLIAQDTTRYGYDLYGRLALPDLLNKLCEIPDVKWIRLLYCYPERVTDELIDVIKTQDKIVKYMDIPFQHVNKDILKRMNRTGDRESLSALIQKMRKEIPGLVLRTTFITGFPGETKEQFEELADFVKEMKFERMGCFPYSQEEDTPAANFPDQVPEQERIDRMEALMAQQDIIMEQFYQTFVDKELEVLCEGYDRLLEMYFGRSAMYAPEIDGMIYFTSSKKCRVGQFLNVKITDVSDNNLLGEAN